MRSTKGTNILAACAAGLGLAGSAEAAEIIVNANIAGSTTWTANNTYNLQQQIYVLPGATLTIEPGTVVASDTDIGGSLAVCKGAQIFVLGSQDKPVIMTSKADVATWTGGNPKTGAWREEANEWGNLTVMGDAYISENGVVGNTPVPDPNNVAAMEGLIAGFPGDTKVLYGGGNDDDDSGTIKYLSLRYGGKVIGLNNELNGLSMGGIGRETAVHHIDIMNNVDDGIEIWGGTFNLKYFNIWNIGDDSLDIDQGWRGKGQFGLIVQGFSLNAVQGSGVGDNMIETDGAEDSDWQPVTTGLIYNVTLIGQPADGDHATAWRDNARMQYRNCTIMDCGEEVVRNDNLDGDGAHGYGFNGTTSWVNTWTTSSATFSAVNPPANPADFYKAQLPGMLAEIKDTVFFRNQHAAAYTEATARGVFDPANNNVLTPGFDPIDAPVASLTRGPLVSKGGKNMLPVTSLDPRPANAALSSVASAPADGFFTPAPYRGAFKPGETWLNSWTASTAFGFTPQTSPWIDLGFELEGINVMGPELLGSGTLVTGTPGSIELYNARASSLAVMFVSLSSSPINFKGGKLAANPFISMITLFTSGTGSVVLPWPAWPAGLTGASLHFQYGISDAAAVKGVALSNCLRGIVP